MDVGWVIGTDNLKICLCIFVVSEYHNLFEWENTIRTFILKIQHMKN